MKKVISIILVLVCLLAGYAYWPHSKLPDDTKVTRIVIEKSRHRLTLYDGEHALKEYPVSIGRGGMAAKTQEGDNLTPEGLYKIDYRKKDSAYHRALHINYPNPNDKVRAKKSNKNPGGDIMIHGLPNGIGVIGRFHRFINWTGGCIAVTNHEIEELWHIVPDNTPVEIAP